jgi:arabinan endo-1,5-alpha-L-arabinosidase
MRRIDLKTGMLSAEDTRLYALAARAQPENPPTNPPGLPGNWQAIEAPFIAQHADYYYLFVSFDLCCHGTKSNYKTMVGRASQVNGPYEDSDGKPMLKGGGTPLLVGNARWLGPGGESVLLQGEKDIIVFHAYDATTGHAFLQISSLSWENGWPHAALEESKPKQ